MPWFLDPVALRRLRESLQLSQREAAKLTGLSLWSIQRHESKTLAPLSLQEESIGRYAEAFRAEQKQFMYWGDQPRERAELGSASTRDVATASGSYEVMSAALHRKCSTAYALFAGRRYAIAGRVNRFAGVPEWAARALDARPGEAAQFQLRLQADGEPPVGVTVFTRVAEHTSHLMDQADKRLPAIVIVELVVRSQRELGQGFPVFARRTAHRLFAFVVVELVTGNAHA